LYYQLFLDYGIYERALALIIATCKSGFRILIF